jgi:hypothetical protein
MQATNSYGANPARPVTGRVYEDQGHNQFVVFAVDERRIFIEYEQGEVLVLAPDDWCGIRPRPASPALWQRVTRVR